MTPVSAEMDKNQDKLAKNHSEIRGKMRVEKIKPQYTKNDVVRVSLIKGPFSRSYDIANSHQRYIIHEVGFLYVNI